MLQLPTSEGCLHNVQNPSVNQALVFSSFVSWSRAHPRKLQVHAWEQAVLTGVETRSSG